MNEKILALSTALDMLREKLIATPRTSKGFGEMRAIYRDLTLALIDAGDKIDAELAREIEQISKGIEDEWESNKAQLAPWLDVLKPVVAAVGTILKAGALSNPLLSLIL